MMDVVAKRISLFGYAFLITVDGAERGRLAHRLFGRPALLLLDGIDYEILRDGPFGFRVEVTGNPGEVARLVRTGMLKRNMMFTWPGGAVHLRRPGLGWRHDLTDDGEVVGTVRGRVLSMSLEAHVPDSMPLPAVALVLWALIRRRRQAVTAGGGA